MFYVENFIKWALTHAKRADILREANLPLSFDECGTEPWQYLFGSVRVRTTQNTLDYYYTNHYQKNYTRAQYDNITANWDRNGYATDCQGLCDAWWTYEQNQQTDINAQMNYSIWCTNKGLISEIDRPYVVGEALFMYSSTQGKMSHVGWICGFDKQGNALAVEARGIKYGVVVTKVADRAWTHRGLMTNVFDYSEPIEEDKPMDKIKFEKVSPMLKGEPFLAMQHALNLAGYTDDAGNELEEDGKWGAKSQQAFEALLANHTAPASDLSPVTPEPVPIIVPEKPIAVFSSDDGEYEFHFVRKDNKA